MSVPEKKNSVCFSALCIINIYRFWLQSVNCLPQTEKRTVVVSKDRHNDVAGEHGDGGLLPRHDALLVVPAGAPVEAPGGVIRHLTTSSSML